MNNRFYIDFHIIQTVPPSCINRDDTGRPKTAIYGGANRARVSSQSWKRAIRKMFEAKAEEYELRNKGSRTYYAIDLITKEIMNISPELDEEKAQKMAADAIKKAGLSTKNNTAKKEITKALFFISSVQVKALAELAVKKETDAKKYKAAIKDNPSIDIAMFGRMAADDSNLNYDAAVQVAHSISTHAIQNEYDYFTAIDDCDVKDDAGVAHLSTNEFNSATLYRYATINVEELYSSVKDATANAVKAFADAFIRSMPTGKQNSYANRTIPDMVYVTIRRDQPVNLAGAFEKPVLTSGGFVEPSVNNLAKYAEKIYSDFLDVPEKSFVVGCELRLDGTEKTNLKKLIEELGKFIEEELNEVE